MTSEEIRIELKLDPWDAFRERPERKEHLEKLRSMVSPVRFTRELNRLSGRTTRMLCTALAAMSKGLRVRIYASNRLYAETIEDNFKTMALKLGIAILMARDIPEVEFFDHTYYEFMDGRI